MSNWGARIFHKRQKYRDSFLLPLVLRLAERKAVALTAVKAAKTLHHVTHVPTVKTSRISVSPQLTQFPRGEAGGLYPRQLSRQATPALNMEKALTRGRFMVVAFCHQQLGNQRPLLSLLIDGNMYYLKINIRLYVFYRRFSRIYHESFFLPLILMKSLSEKYRTNKITHCEPCFFLCVRN